MKRMNRIVWKLYECVMVTYVEDKAEAEKIIEDLEKLGIIGKLD